jgi:hypothetical protein
LLHHASLNAWLSEKEHEVLKIEATVTEPLSFGFGLAKIRQGSTFLVERQMIKERIWSLSKIDFTANGRLFYVKGMNEREITEYSGFKEYSVETILNVVEK